MKTIYIGPKLYDVKYFACPACDMPMAITSGGQLTCFTCGHAAPIESVTLLTAAEIDAFPRETYVARLRAMQPDA